MKKILITLIAAVASTPAFAGKLDSVAFLRGCWGTTNEDGARITEDWFKNYAVLARAGSPWSSAISSTGRTAILGFEFSCTSLRS